MIKLVPHIVYNVSYMGSTKLDKILILDSNHYGEYVFADLTPFLEIKGVYMIRNGDLTPEYTLSVDLESTFEILNDEHYFDYAEAKQHKFKVYLRP